MNTKLLIAALACTALVTALVSSRNSRIPRASGANGANGIGAQTEARPSGLATALTGAPVSVPNGTDSKRVLAPLAAPAELAPPLSPAPSLSTSPLLLIEPLEFAIHETPGEDPGVPPDLWQLCLATTREHFAGFELENGEYALTYVRTYLAHARLDADVELWVHVDHAPVVAGGARAEIRIRDSLTGRISKTRITLETRFCGSDPEDLPRTLARADLDADGRMELVVRDIDHPGTGVWDEALHWFAIGLELVPVRKLTTADTSYVAWNGLSGMFRSRLLQDGAGGLLVEGWYDPESDAQPAVELGVRHYVPDRPDGPYRLAREELSPDAVRLTGWSVDTELGFRPDATRFVTNGGVQLLEPPKGR